MMGVLCPLCCRVYPCLKSLLTHIHQTHGSDWKNPYRCGQEGCQRTFGVTNSWTKHIKRKHSACLESGASTSTASAHHHHPTNDSDSGEDIADAGEPFESVSTSAGELLNVVDRSAADFVLRLRSSSSVTIGTCTQAVESANELVETVVSYLREETAAYISQCAPTANITELIGKFDAVKNPLNFLATDQKQRKYFEQHENYVAPEEINFGVPRIEVRKDF